MTEVIPEADLAAGLTSAPAVPGARLSLGARAWSLFEGGRDPYVILVTIYIFMPYFAAVVVGGGVAGQSAVASYGQYSGWIVCLTAPFLGASIDQAGPRKGWLALVVTLMAPLMWSLWFTTPDHKGLSVGAVIAIATVIAVLFSYSEVLHNSLLVRAAGLGGAHKASSLALALVNACALIALGFTAWAFALPGHVDWGWVPKAPSVRPEPGHARDRPHRGPDVGGAVGDLRPADLPLHPRCAQDRDLAAEGPARRGAKPGADGDDHAQLP